MDKSDDSGSALMKAPKGAKACSWDGTTFAVDKDGTVLVPQAAVNDLVSHGYVLVDSD